MPESALCHRTILPFVIVLTIPIKLEGDPLTLYVVRQWNTSNLIGLSCSGALSVNFDDTTQT